MPYSPPEETKTPSEAILKLLAPDGYYTYLGIDKTVAVRSASDSDPSHNNSNSISNASLLSPSSSVDEELIKKSYRKLSLRHHPDRPTGDADTFRVLNRAQKVLLNPILRQQYDLLGLDIDDEEEADAEHATNSGRNTSSDAGEDGDEGNSSSGSSWKYSIKYKIFDDIFEILCEVLIRTGKIMICARFCGSLRGTARAVLCLVSCSSIQKLIGNMSHFRIYHTLVIMGINAEIGRAHV